MCHVICVSRDVIVFRFICVSCYQPDGQVSRLCKEKMREEKKKEEEMMEEDEMEVDWMEEEKMDGKKHLMVQSYKETTQVLP